MSVFTSRSSLLAVKPGVWIEGQKLYARTSLLMQLLSLFSFYRQICIDHEQRYVEISTRYLWAFAGIREIEFDDIDHIDYTHHSMGTKRRWTLRGLEEHDTFEWYAVSLILNDETTVPLFTFSGEGAVVTGWSGVMWGDSVYDVAGDQDVASRRYVDMIAAFTGKPLRKISDFEKRHRERPDRRCEDCGRPLPISKDTCIYCGGAAADPEDAEA